MSGTGLNQNTQIFDSGYIDDLNVSNTIYYQGSLLDPLLASKVSALETDVAQNTTDIATNTSNIATNTSNIAGKVNKSGDTMTGQLVIDYKNLSLPEHIYIKENNAGDTTFLKGENTYFNKYFNLKYNSLPDFIDWDTNNNAYRHLINGTALTKIAPSQTDFYKKIVANEAIEIPTFIPTTTTNMLYYNGTDLYWNGNTLGVSQSLLNDVAQNTSDITTIKGAGWVNETIKGNASDIATNTLAINTIKGAGWTNETIYDNAQDIAGNTTDINTIKGAGWVNETIKGNATDIAGNTQDITTIKGVGWVNETIKGNATNIATNTTNISTNSNAITTIKGAGWVNETIKGNATNIATNTANISTNTSAINTIKGAGWVNETIKGNATNIATNTTAITGKVAKTGDTMTGDLVLSGADLDITDGTNTARQEISNNYWRLKWNGSDLLQASTGVFNFIGATYYSAPLVLSGDGNDVIVFKTGTSGKSLLLQAGDEVSSNDDYSIVMNTRNSSNTTYTIFEARGKDERIENNRLALMKQGIKLENFTPASTTNTLYYNGTELMFNGSPVSSSVSLDGDVNTYETDGTTLNFTLANNGIDIKTAKTALSLQTNQTTTVNLNERKVIGLSLTSVGNYPFNISITQTRTLTSAGVKFYVFKTGGLVDSDGLNFFFTITLLKNNTQFAQQQFTLVYATNGFYSPTITGLNTSFVNGDTLTVRLDILETRITPNPLFPSAYTDFGYDFREAICFYTQPRSKYGFYTDTTNTIVENDDSLVLKTLGEPAVSYSAGQLLVRSFNRNTLNNDGQISLWSPDDYSRITLSAYTYLNNKGGWKLGGNTSGGTSLNYIESSPDNGFKFIVGTTERAVIEPLGFQITQHSVMNNNTSGGGQIGNLQYAGIQLKCQDGSNLRKWNMSIYTGDFLVFNHAGGTNNDGYIAPSSNNAIMNFTGQHRNRIIEEDVALLRKGMILVSTGKISNCLVEPINEPTIDEALPILQLSTKPKQKSIFGVYSGNENVLNHQIGVFGTPLDVKNPNKDFHFVNGSGEGGILVCGENGNIENGDFIITSSRKGIGMKSDNENFNCYVIAKASMDYVFKGNEEVLISCLYML